jgi:sulfite oxidase
MQGDITVEKQELPTYRRTDVNKHRRAADGVWVTYGDGVYDITEFLKIHPGGADKVMLAAGGPLEPFW